QARLDEGDVDAAQDAFGRAEALIEAESFGPGGRDWLARVGVQLAVCADEIDDARRWSEQIADPFWGGVSAARVHLAVGNRVGALAALDGVVPRCARHDVVLALLRARSASDHDECVKHTVNAAELATANGLLQTVASEGADMVELIERSAWQVPPRWLDRLRRATAEGSHPHRDRIDLVEPLTERERDVLRFLASRLTVREIADELYLSINTLKFHLKAIYRKLGVNSRAEAAEAARRMARGRPAP
ncbi:MAG: LuxR C-terminal-related transcriptional regulator, partial [Acidimicrobiales bacterium]